MNSGSEIRDVDEMRQIGRRARYAILALQREGNRRLAGELARVNLSPAQAEVLSVIGAHEPVTLKGLGEMLVCETGSPSRLVASLVERGHLARIQNARDRREMSIRLTSSGRGLLPDIQLAEASVDGALYDSFGESHLRELFAAVLSTLEGRPVADALRRRFCDE